MGLALVAACACATPSQSLSAAAAGSERAQIYSAVLDAEFDGATPGSSVIAAETYLAPWYRTFLDPSHPSYPVWCSLVADQEARPRGVSLGSRDTSLTYITVADRAKVFRAGDAGWPIFFARYPGAKGVLTFSEVGFDPDGRRALVYAFLRCGADCGHGGIFALEQADGQWRVSEHVLPVESQEHAVRVKS